MRGPEGAAARGRGGVTPEQHRAAMAFYHQRTKLQNEQAKHGSRRLAATAQSCWGLPRNIVSSWRPVSLRADNTGDDVAVVAAAIARESQLLCFDELQAP